MPTIEEARAALAAKAANLPPEVRAGFILGLEAGAMFADASANLAGEWRNIPELQDLMQEMQVELQLVMETTLRRGSQNIAAAIRSVIVTVEKGAGP